MPSMFQKQGIKREAETFLESRFRKGLPSGKPAAYFSHSENFHLDVIRNRKGQQKLWRSES